MGRLRGKRNRDQDRYWTEQRRAEQSGMVGAIDVPMCCFCGHLVASVDAIETGFGDVLCRACAIERDLIQPLRIHGGEGLAALTSAGFIEYSGSVSSRGGRQSGHLNASFDRSAQSLPKQDAYLRRLTLERMERELIREQQREASRMERELIREQQREASRMERELIREQREASRMERELIREQREASRYRRYELHRWMCERDARARMSKRVFVRLSADLVRSLAFHCSVQEAIDGAFGMLSTTNAVVEGYGRPSGQQFKHAQPVQRTDIGSVSMARRMLIMEKDRQFTRQQIIKIRTLYAAGGIGQKRLAEGFKTTQATIAQIVMGSTYKSASGPIHVPAGDKDADGLYMRFGRSGVGWFRATHSVAGSGLVHS